MKQFQGIHALGNVVDFFEHIFRHLDRTGEFLLKVFLYFEKI